jgi:outer membrane cobalamin receptor
VTGLLVAAALRLSPLLAAAGDVPPPAGEPILREEVVVVAERRPAPLSAVGAALSTLDAEAVARLPAATVADLVGSLPGFQMAFDAPFGGLPMESARGFFGGGEAGYALLLVDGVPLADVESGAAEWSALPASAVTRVEALRGPAGPLYGDTAFGGVVDVRTRTATEGPALAVGIGGGSVGTALGDARAAVSFPAGAAALDVDGRHTDGWREHAADESAAARFRLDLQGGDTGSWTLTAAGWRASREDPGPLTLAQIAADRRASDDAFAADRASEQRRTLALSWRRDGALTAAARAAAEQRELDALRTLLLAAGFPDSSWRHLDSDSVSAAADLAGELATSRVGWSGGIELGRDRLASGYRAVVPPAGVGEPLAAAHAERERRAVWASGSWDASAALRLAAALRWDALRDASGAAGQRHEAWSPRLGIGWRPVATARWLVFAQWSEAFKAPSLDQRFDPRPFPDGAGGSFSLANPNLLPQRAHTVELGARGFGPGGSWQLALYRTAVDDEIDFDPATFRYLNLGSSLHRGVELGGDLVRTSRGRVGVGWEWSEVFARDGATAGLQLKNVPEHTYRLTADAHLVAGVEGALTARHLAGRFLDDSHTHPLGGATLVDVRLRRSWGPWELWADVRNLLADDFLWVGYALPDFAGGTVPYAFPGHGRAFVAGVRWRADTRPIPATGGS